MHEVLILHILLSARSLQLFLSRKTEGIDPVKS